MSEALKHKFYNDNSLRDLAFKFAAVYPSFLIDGFVGDIMDETWDELELKARMRKITISLRTYLPPSYEQALEIIDQVIERLPSGYRDNAFIFFPDFVEVYGQDECHWDLSISALERYTLSSSAEFAVRPFIIHHEERMMKQMAVWSKHDNEHVRRLASEGCRPRLPWAQALSSFQKDPSPVLAILENLKVDPSLYVRKSVANNLNDISKTHPNLVIKLAKEWYGKHAYTDWIVKHGCRTLLKKGNPKVLAIFGYTNPLCVALSDFALQASAIQIGANLVFSFAISSKEPTKVRLEYGIDYVKANRKRHRKIFQLSKITLTSNQKKKYSKTHSLADMSTRKHYPGLHSIVLIVNGTEFGNLNFELTM